MLSSIRITLLFLITTTLVEARPHRRNPVLAPNLFAALKTNDQAILGAYTVPLSNGTATLPAPSANLKLKALGLGRGTQNYTCATSTSSSTPAPIGAVATLFDASFFLPLVSPLEGQEILNILPGYLVTYALNILSPILPVLGSHFFTGPTTPNFDLTAHGGPGRLVAAKTGDIVAPKGSATNAQGAGAVDWLQVQAAGGMGSEGLSMAYRVYTAGGKAPATCLGQGKTIEVPYAAQYWFFD
ncbi:hypothetical protein MMC25_001311 [Agyrium rufum]|nr:hypothetical protein [Agyrium rufum]